MQQAAYGAHVRHTPPCFLRGRFRGHAGGGARRVQRCPACTLSMTALLRPLRRRPELQRLLWIPACAGMTRRAISARRAVFARPVTPTAPANYQTKGTGRPTPSGGFARFTCSFRCQSTPLRARLGANLDACCLAREVERAALDGRGGGHEELAVARAADGLDRDLAILGAQYVLAGGRRRVLRVEVVLRRL